MSTEIMMWGIIKPKSYNSKSKEGFKAFFELLEIDNLNVLYQMNDSTLMYLEMQPEDKEMIKKIKNLEDGTHITVMGSGDSWAFESAQSILKTITFERERVSKQLARNDLLMLDRINKIFDTIEKTDLQLEYIHMVDREENPSVGDFFDEFVWCSHPGCDYPAEFNYRKNLKGIPVGRDEFFGGKVGAKDIPLCYLHYIEKVK